MHVTLVQATYPARGKLKTTLASNHQAIPAEILHRRRSGVLRGRVGPIHSEPRTEPITDIGFDKDFHSIYTLGKQIGKGTEGDVFIGHSVQSNEEFAVKRVKKLFLENDDGDTNGIKPEFCNRMRDTVDIYNQIGSGLTIAYLYGAYEDDEYVYTVQELCSGGELWEHIGDHYSEAYAARIMRSVLQTMAQLHDHGVVWRDSKPENFLFLNDSEDSPLKAVDFGTAVRCRQGEHITIRAGSPLYVAPEVLKPQRYNHSADLWGAGMLAFMILTAQLPFTTTDASVSVADLYSGRVNITRRQAFEALLGYHIDLESQYFCALSDGAQEFIRMLLQHDPELRPTAEEALQHHWIQSDASDEPFSSSLVQRLQRFGSYNRFKQVVLQAMVQEVIDTDHMLIPRDLHDEFAKLDVDGDGTVSIYVLRDKLQAEPFSLSPQEVERLLKQIDTNDTDDVKYDEWLAAMLTWTSVQKCQEWDKWVEKAFSQMDSSGSGSLTTEELSRFLCSDGLCLSADRLRDALQDAHGAAAASADEGDGLSLQTFKDLMRGGPRPDGSRDDDDLNIYGNRVSPSKADLLTEKTAKL